MIPRVFIASSAENAEITAAIHWNLERETHPQPWTSGVFGLSEETTKSLMREVKSCDFGIFVLSPDDVAEVRGKLLRVPRDNVIYEMGLFSGSLGTERCFFVIPRGVDVHLPSDLLGITAGTYDASRPRGEIKTAVSTFCNDALVRIKNLGNRDLSSYERITGLAFQYENCELIENMTTRFGRKEHTFTEMVSVCQSMAVSKRRLVNSDRSGFIMAFAASIVANPDGDDWNMLLSCDPLKVTRGNAQHNVIAAMNTLKKRNLITLLQKSELVNWASRMPDPELLTPPKISLFAS